VPVEAERVTIELGDHVVQFYEAEADLIGTVSGYLGAAIRAGELAVVVATEGHRDAFEAELEAAGIRVAEARRSGLFVSLDAAGTVSRFLSDGRIDPGGFHSVIGGVMREAVRTGRPVRAYGEMVALLWDAGNVLAAIELETLWNDLGRQLPFSLLCAYPAQSMSGAEHPGAWQDVCHLHSAVLDARPGVDGHLEHRRSGKPEETCGFPAELDAPGAARRFVVDVLGRWQYDDDLVDEVALVVTELTTNAVVHGWSPFTVGV
jgi:hypothetical protein